MRSKADEIEIELGVFNFTCPPTEITRALNMEPDHVSVQGQQEQVGTTPEGPLLRTARSSTWVLKLPDAGLRSIDDQISALLEKVRPVQLELKRLSDLYIVELSIFVYCYSGSFGAHIDKALVQKLGEMGIELDFDIYFLTDDG